MAHSKFHVSLAAFSFNRMTVPFCTIQGQALISFEKRIVAQQHLFIVMTMATTEPLKTPFITHAR